MTEAELAAELEQLEVEIDDIGRQIVKKKDRMLELLKGRICTRRHQRFRIDRATIHFTGMGGARVFFSGPVLKIDGSPHARAGESAPLAMIDRIEPK